MNNDYPYTTPEQQIQKLKEQQLAFSDDNTAMQALKTYGYYNIINGYRDPYLVRSYGQKKYSPGTTFDQIFSLFMFDREIREAVLCSMVTLEEHLRAIVADIVAEDFGTDHTVYLQKNNYRDKYVSNPRFRRNSILNDMKETAEKSYTQPIRYYRETHNIVPPWILLKGVYFATLVNFVRFFKAPQRDKLISALYGNRVNAGNIDEYKDILSDSLSLCLEYRNLAAHGGRIYNHVPQSNIRYLENTEVARGLPQLMHTLSLFEYKSPYKKLDNGLTHALNNYCPQFPNDLERLEQATGFHIFKENRVWVNENTKKFHCKQYCSGSSNNVSMLLTEAKNLGFAPCKRCCRIQ